MIDIDKNNAVSTYCCAFYIICNFLQGNCEHGITGCGKIKDPTAKCIIVPLVLNFHAKFSGTVPGIVYRLQY